MNMKFQINDIVEVEPKDDFPPFEFIGRIIYCGEDQQGERQQLYVVRDQNDDRWTCEEEQLKIYEP